jgi:hypothetical protein
MNWIPIPCNRWTIIKWLSPFSQNVPCGQIASLRTDSNSHHQLGLVKSRPGLQNLWWQTPWRWVRPTQKRSHKLTFFPSLWAPNLGTQNGLLLALALQIRLQLQVVQCWPQVITIHSCHCIMDLWHIARWWSLAIFSPSKTIDLR